MLAGIVCSNGIILASDSLLVDWNSGDQNFVDKISVVDFLLDQVLIAEAGLPTVTNRGGEIIQRKARGLKITDASVVIKIVEDSVSEAITTRNKKQKDFINQHGAELLVAFYANDHP